MIKTNHRGYGNNDVEFWREELVCWNYYKDCLGCSQSHIRFLHLFSPKHKEGFDFFLSMISMSQSQMLGKTGDMKHGEGNRKRLKISVTHFDNSDLIKNYSKTLIWKCMNPEEQYIKALIVMLPKIWKLEDRVVRADLGLGKFQFDFVKEEAIEAVLNIQPFHFDYLMIYLVR